MKTFITLAFLISGISSIAQPSFKKKSFEEFEGSKDRSISIVVELSTLPAAQENFSISVDLDSTTASYSDYDFNNKTQGYPIVFVPNGSKEQIMQLTIKEDDELESVERIQLLLKDSKGANIDTAQVDIKTIEDKHSFKDIEKYISLGGTFDFENGVSDVNRYSEAIVTTPYFSLRKKSKLNKGKNAIRMHFGYQNGTSNTQDSLRVTIDETIFDQIDDTTFLKLDQSGSLNISRKFKYFSIFARPAFRLTPENTAANFELLANFEFVRRTITREYETDDFKSDTTSVILFSDDQEGLNTRSLFPPYLSRSKVNNEGYIGAGFNFTYDWPKSHVFLNTTLNYALHDLTSRTPNDDPNTNRLAYVTQFGFIQKDIGLKLGGEFRAKAIDDHPVVTIYLAKMFSMSKLKEFVTSF